MRIKWRKIPADWILEDEGVLKSLRWKGAEKSDYVAALMLYIALIHHTDDQDEDYEPATIRVTYSNLEDTTGLSRPKVSNGLSFLENNGLISKRFSKGAMNEYLITNYEKKSGWRKLPVRGLYKGDKQIDAFKDFTLRSKVELNALKLYFLLIALRNNTTGYTQVSYEKIYERTGIRKDEIKSAISRLINIGLINLDKKAEPGEYQHNVYWVRYIGERHAGNAPNH